MVKREFSERGGVTTRLACCYFNCLFSLARTSFHFETIR